MDELSENDYIGLIYLNMNKILDENGMYEWTGTPIPALDNKTPFHMMCNGQSRTLWEYTETYSDSTFA